MAGGLQHGNSNALEVMEPDYIVCECDLEPLQKLVLKLEQSHRVEIRKSPSVVVDGHVGFGLCLGDEPVRAYCIAVVDALSHLGLQRPLEMDAFLREQGEAVARRDQDEFDLILQTQVDFKLMEEA
jgi:alpha-D-ribose 1-methylphosphonate 5-triphosphate synthase subunit PhnG